MRFAIVGADSDIVKGLIPLIEKDGHQAVTHTRSDGPLIVSDFEGWEVLLIPYGTVMPVGYWWEQDIVDWRTSIDINLVKPFEVLKKLWEVRNTNREASVCFFAGSNPQKPMAGYSAYNAGKMGLLKLVEQLDFESWAGKFFALAPGYVPTKIHRPTLEACWTNERIARNDGGTPIENIWTALSFCINAPKTAVGGRNICVSDVMRHQSTPTDLEGVLIDNPWMFKLRRTE